LTLGRRDHCIILSGNDMYVKARAARPVAESIQLQRKLSIIAIPNRPVIEMILRFPEAS
jgi:hypothetical protein